MAIFFVFLFALFAVVLGEDVWNDRQFQHIYASHQMQTMDFHRSQNQYMAGDVVYLVENKEKYGLQDIICIELTTFATGEEECLSVRENPTGDPDKGTALQDDQLQPGTSCDNKIHPLKGRYCTASPFMSVHLFNTSHYGFVSFFFKYYIAGPAPNHIRTLYGSKDVQTFYHSATLEPENATWLFHGPKKAQLCISFIFVNLIGGEEVSIWQNYDADPMNGHALKTFRLYAYDVGPFCVSDGYLSIHYKTVSTLNPKAFSVSYYLGQAPLTQFYNLFANYQPLDLSLTSLEPYAVKTWLIYSRPNTRICVSITSVQLRDHDYFEIGEHATDYMKYQTARKPIHNGTQGETYCGQTQFMSILYQSDDTTAKTRGFEATYYLEKVEPITTVPPVTTPGEAKFPWPLQNLLLGLWPLDATHEMREIKQIQRRCSQCNGVLDKDKPGPFGRLGTSYRREDVRGETIFDHREIVTTKEGSVTISFFIRAATNASGGLLTFGKSLMGDLNLRIVSHNETRPLLQLYGKDQVYGTYDVLQPNQWSFVAIALSKSFESCTLSINGHFGLVYQEQRELAMCDQLTKANTLVLGYAYPDYLSTDVSVSCLSIHAAALLGSEIEAVQEACRAVQGTPSCGAAYPPHPTVPSPGRTIPKQGQFPWIANLRLAPADNKTLCAASILDRYFLLTSASCLGKDANVSNLRVRVGDYFTSLAEATEWKHFVQNIYIHPKYKFDDLSASADLAIIELVKPIDFHNEYVNTICLPESYSYPVPEKTYYFFGWGNNGRRPLVSRSAPRYVVGKVPKGDRCGVTYHDFPNATVCFETTSPGAEKAPCSFSDKGGPLMIEQKDVLGNGYLMPVAIFHKRSDCSSSPSLFTLIGPHVTWIRETIACILPGHSYPKNCPIIHQV